MARTEVRGEQIKDQTVSLTADVKDVLPVPNGGTGVATVTGLVKGNGTSAMSAATAGTDYTTPTGTESLGAKTITDQLDVAQVSVPSTPSTGRTRIFTGTSKGLDALAWLNSIGVPFVVCRDVLFYGRNATGVTIPVGTPVYLAGASGSNPMVAPAQGDATATKGPCVGIAVAAVGNNVTSAFMVRGVLSNFNTSAWAQGDTLYVSPTTPGALTNIRPAHPAIPMTVGYVENVSASLGTVMVNVSGRDSHALEGVNGTSFAVGDATGTTKSILLKNAAGTGTVQWNPSANRTLTLPDATGTVYVSGSTDVSLADGGTGASLTDPNADRILFWDDSLGAMTWLQLGTNLSITGTTLDAAGGGGSGDMVLASAQTITGAKTFNINTLLDKGSHVFNVRAYGAVGNGTTVDTTAFNNAISACVAAGGGVVYAPAGTYKIGGVALASNVILRGAGIGATVLKMDHTGSDTLVVRVSSGSTTAANRVGLEHLTIDGDKATLGSGNTSTRYGYYMGITAGTAVTDCWVDHCEFKNCKTYALDILEVSRITVTNCVSHDNGYTTGTGNNCSGFESHADDVLFSNCFAYSNGNHGFICGNSTAHKRTKLMNCIATANAQAGIYIGDAMTDSSIIGCTSHTNTKWGIAIGPNAHRTIIQGNTLYANVWQGIDIDSSNNCVISGNMLNGNSTSGFDDEIKLEGTTAYTIIDGNQILTASTNKSIHEYDTANYTIGGNNIRDRAMTLIGANSGAKRITTLASTATPAIDVNIFEEVYIPALATNITSFTTNLTGTPVQGQTLWIAITGTATRTIAWGASFEASTVALPTTTSGTNRLDVGFKWNHVTSKWRCVAAG